MSFKQILYAIAIGSLLITGCEKETAAPVGKNNKIEASIPVISVITQVSALATMSISGDAFEDVLEKGICYSTTADPTISDLKVSAGDGTGVVSTPLSGLLPATTYYARSYFQTRNETVYSKNISFRTLSYQLPTVTTSSVANVTLTGALGYGSVTASGGGTVSARGLCWSTTTSPTISNSRTASGSGLGSFSADLYPLSAGTTYYVRAYATNQAGTSYGGQISFTTVAVKLATVGSVTVTSITKTSAFTSATVSADGGGTVTSRGVCYATNTSSPTITSNNFTNNGTGIGAAGGTLSALLTGTTYYIRAYAVNSAGVSYGPASSFRTL